MDSTRLLAILALAATAIMPTHAEDMKPCGTVTYFPSEYACYNNSTLCPVMYSLPSVPCSGTGGCYASEMYSCAGGTLKTLPKASSPFTLTAHGTRDTYKNLTVKACGGYLAIGANARQCTSCRGAGSGVQCSSYRNDAVLLPEGQMSADVPGGQFWYVNPLDGGLQYTATGNETEWGKQFAAQNVTIYQNGFFVYQDEPHYWLACLRTLPGGVPGTGRTFRLFAPTAGNLERGDCEQVRLASTVVDRKQGAYKYD